MNNSGPVYAFDLTKSVSDVRRAPLHSSAYTYAIGGAVAGMFTDIALYPLDTLKTRLQSQSGFWKSGGFHGVCKGVGFTSLMTPISSGIFFGTYVTVKHVLDEKNGVDQHYLCPLVHMFSSTIAQVVSSAVDVPTEVIKQRRQTSKEDISCLRIAKLAVEQEGIAGLYRGFVELPLWEWMRTRWKCQVERELNAIEAAVCGAVACAIATTLTTPFDVVQTHIILANAGNNLQSVPDISSQVKNIYRRHGISKLFSGFVPRLSMGLVGGSIFFGVFDLCSFFSPSVQTHEILFLCACILTWLLRFRPDNSHRDTQRRRSTVPTAAEHTHIGLVNHPT